VGRDEMPPYARWTLTSHANRIAQQLSASREDGSHPCESHWLSVGMFSWLGVYELSSPLITTVGAETSTTVSLTHL
jgi:hypothetical protein